VTQHFWEHITKHKKTFISSDRVHIHNTIQLDKRPVLSSVGGPTNYPLLKVCNLFCNVSIFAICNVSYSAMYLFISCLQCIICIFLYLQSIRFCNVSVLECICLCNLHYIRNSNLSDSVTYLFHSCLQCIYCSQVWNASVY